MPDDEEPRLSSGQALIKLLEEGGLPQIIAGPAGKALSRLIGSAADIPAAWLENHAKSIRDDTRARSQIKSSIAAAAAKKAAKDPDIVDRAILSALGKNYISQINREQIARKTVEQLRLDPPTSEKDNIDEDWMNIFVEHAGRASSENMRDLWARVLAGEIRKPNSFSLRTLGFVATLDAEIAKEFEYFASYITNGGYILGDKRFDWTDQQEKLNFLIECGLFNRSIGLQLDFDDSGKLNQFDKNGGFVIEGTPSAYIRVDIVPLSKIGKELYNIVNPNYSIEIQRETAKMFLLNLQVNSVDICNVKKMAGDKVLLEPKETLTRQAGT